MSELEVKFEGVTEDVAVKLLRLQPRCILCGSTYSLHLHHRIFKSEGEIGLRKFLVGIKETYETCYKRKLEFWRLNDIQNLCVLCQQCHEGNEGVHGKNSYLRNKLRNSFTCSVSGFNVPYYKKKDQLF